MSSVRARFDFSSLAVYAGFILAFLFFSATLWDNGFLSSRNLTNIVLQTAPATVLAVGLVFVLAAGEIDLSFGATTALAAIVAAIALRDAPLAVGVLAGLGAGVGVGAINGMLVSYARMPSFLVTLATMGIVAGVARQVSDLQSIPVTNNLFVGLLGNGHVLGVPSLILWTIGIVATGYVVLRHTRFGAHVLAVGDNPRAALVSGIRVARLRLSVLMVSGACAGLAGLLYAGRVQSARYTLGETDLMTVIAAVIVGGTSLTGGRATVLGALAGSLLMGMMSNGLILMGLSVNWQMIIKGLIVLVAVAISLREPNR